MRWISTPSGRARHFELHEGFTADAIKASHLPEMECNYDRNQAINLLNRHMHLCGAPAPIECVHTCTTLTINISASIHATIYKLIHLNMNVFNYVDNEKEKV